MGRAAAAPSETIAYAAAFSRAMSLAKETTMADAYHDDPEKLVRFYAEKIAAGFGPAAGRKLDRDIEEARVVGDRRRQEFWERVKERVGAGNATRR